MRKITIIGHISQDGIIQAPGGPDEDRDGGFEYGGWTVPFQDPVVGEAVMSTHGERLDLLLGRRVYDIWADYWPKESNPIADSFNTAKKYVATHRPESLEWGPAEDLGTDIVEGIRRIKSREGPHIITWGSSTLMPVLLEHGLVDEIVLIVYPVFLGKGKRFFSEGSAPRELSLIDSKAGASGVIVNTYRPVGPLRTGSFAELK